MYLTTDLEADDYKPTAPETSILDKLKLTNHEIGEDSGAGAEVKDENE